MRQERGVVIARELEAGEVVGETAVVGAEDSLEAGAYDSEGAVYGACFPSGDGGLQRKIEGPAHPGDAELLGDSRYSVQDGGQQMRVLVRVEMGGL